MPSSRCFFFASAVVTALCAGCEREPAPDLVMLPEYGQTLCAAMFACECEHPRWALESVCLREAEERLGIGHEEARDTPGVTFDEDCAQRRIDLFAEQGCAPELLENWSEKTCDFFTGEAGEGEPCQNFGLLGDSCEPGLTCSGIFSDVICRAPAEPIRIPLGEPCPDAPEGYNPCEDGLYCPDETRVCEPVPVPGSDCSSDSDCNPLEPTMWCEDFVCSELLQPGDPCTEDRQCPDICEFDRCALILPDPLVCDGPFL